MTSGADYILPKGITLKELAERKKEIDLPKVLGTTPALVFRTGGDEATPLYLTPDEGFENQGGYSPADDTSVLNRGDVPMGGDLGKAVVVPLTPTHHNLHEEQVLVGRGKSNDVRLVSPQVSKLHARFVSEDGEWKLRDEGSSNGTRINGVKLEPNRSYGLRAGDEIVVGDIVVLYVDADGLLDLTNVV